MKFPWSDRASPIEKAVGEQLAEWFNDGWRIESTSCMCGGSWAWVKQTNRGTFKMFGCICHHVPNRDFK